jgi:hypothetical protein
MESVFFEEMERGYGLKYMEPALVSAARQGYP